MTRSASGDRRDRMEGWSSVPLSALCDSVVKVFVHSGRRHQNHHHRATESTEWDGDSSQSSVLSPRLLLPLRRASVALAVFAALLLPSAHAQVVSFTGSGSIAVAHDGVVELYGADQRRLWSAAGVRYAGAIAMGSGFLAVLDPIHGEVVTIGHDGTGRRVFEGLITPIGAAWIDDDLYVLDRERARVERIDRDGARTSVPVGIYPQFLRVSGKRLYVYSRGDGRLVELTARPLGVARSAAVQPFASDFEVHRDFAYLVYPGDAKIVAVALENLTVAGEDGVGGVPIDLAIAAGSSVLTASQLAIADPSSKRVWLVEAPQSEAAAFGRGFLRGLVGLGTFGKRTSAFPTGIDRIVAAGGRGLAYDSSKRALYSFHPRKTSLLAKNIAPGAFSLRDGQIAYWNGMLVAQKLN